MLFSSTQSIHILNFESSGSVALHSEFHSTGARQSRLSYLGLGAYWLSKAFSASSRLSSKSAMLLVRLATGGICSLGQAKFVSVQLAVLCMGFLPPSISSKLIKLESNLFSPNYP